jgi:hypothetical protein
MQIKEIYLTAKIKRGKMVKNVWFSKHISAKYPYFEKLTE